MTEPVDNADGSTAEDRAIDDAIRRAVREALERHARLGEDVVIFRDGRTQRVPAAVALRLADEDAERERRG